MNLRVSSSLLLGSFLITACAEGPCHEMRRPDLAAQATGATNGLVAANGTPTPSGGSMVNANKPAAGHVLVAKADGSKQCQAGGVAPDEMEKDLGGLKVYARSKRSDGKMHAQVCGAPTGKLNVFEIDQASLAEAQKRGFTLLEPKP